MILLLRYGILPYLQGLRICLSMFSLLVFLSSLQTNAQQLNFRSFSFDQGLNTYNIQKTIQDKYGFIWIATQDGLYRYNGNTFEAIRKTGDGSISLQGNFVFDIFYGGGDTLYVAIFNGGIDAIHIRTLSITHILDEQPKSGNSLPNLWIKKVYADQQQNLWIGGMDFLSLYSTKDKTLSNLTGIPGFEGAVNVSFIKPIGTNTIAVGIVDLGILLFNSASLQIIGQITNFTDNPKRRGNQVTDLLIKGEDTYLASNAGIIKGKFFNHDWEFKKLFLPNTGDSCIISCLANDRKGDLWIGSSCGLVRLNLNTGDFTSITSQMSQSRWLVDNSIRHLLVDNQHNLWLSTSKVLQFVNLNPNPFTHYSGNKPGSSKMDHVYALVPKSDHEIFASGTDGLYITDLVTGLARKVKGSQALGVIHYITKIDADVWLVSTDQGMFPYSAAKEQLLSQEYLLKKFPEWKPYIRHYFNTSIRIKNRFYWGSEGQEGLLIWDLERGTIGKQKADITSPGELPENHIHNIKQDRDGYLWLMFDNSVAKYNATTDSVVQVIHFEPGSSTFNSRIFFDAFDDGTRIWFGSYSGGLNGYNKKTGSWEYITEKEGLCNNAVYGILPERDSIFWVSTNMGISRVNYITKKCNNYFFEDGLQDNSFDEMGALTVGQRLFFGGINGFTMIDLAHYKTNPEPFPVYIHRVEYITRGQRKVLNELLWEELDLPPNTSSIIVHLSGLSFSNSKKINFSSKIKEYEDDFLPVSDDNKIILNAMNKGDYELQIRYLNEAGEFISDRLKLNLSIAPIWYQTWWFKILLGVIAIALVYGVYRYRINQVLKEQKIRRSIASDLHDDIGSTLTSAKMLTHLALATPADQEKIKVIEWNLEQASANLRDMVWVLDDRLDTVSDLIDRLRKQGLPLAEAVHITLDFSTDDSARNISLSKAEKKNLYLISKEAIHNSLKYANCSKISIRFTFQKKKLSVSIEDDGKGFNMNLSNEGYGLKNMKERAKQINFAASIYTAEGIGTRILLSKNA